MQWGCAEIWGFDSVMEEEEEEEEGIQIWEDVIALNDTDRSPNFDDIVKVDIPFILTVGFINDTHALEELVSEVPQRHSS